MILVIQAIQPWDQTRRELYRENTFKRVLAYESQFS